MVEINEYTKIMMLHNLISCSLTDRYNILKEPAASITTLKMEAAVSSEIVVSA
jgi:hypothetical protein